MSFVGAYLGYWDLKINSVCTEPEKKSPFGHVTVHLKSTDTHTHTHTHTVDKYKLISALPNEQFCTKMLKQIREKIKTIL